VGGFVIALASFSIDQQSGVAVNDRNGISVPLPTGPDRVPMCCCCASPSAYLFVGVGGSIDKAGYANAAAFEQWTWRMPVPSASSSATPTSIWPSSVRTGAGRTARSGSASPP
jgi:hypothetical protein